MFILETCFSTSSAIRSVLILTHSSEELLLVSKQSMKYATSPHRTRVALFRDVQSFCTSSLKFQYPHTRVLTSIRPRGSVLFHTTTSKRPSILKPRFRLPFVVPPDFLIARLTLFSRVTLDTVFSFCTSLAIVVVAKYSGPSDNRVRARKRGQSLR